MITVIVNRKEFRAAVSLVRQTIEPRAKGAMACIRIEGQQSELKLSTTAWDAQTTTHTGCVDSPEPFDVCIDMKRFALELNRAKGDTFTFHVHTSNHVKIPCVDIPFEAHDPSNRPPQLDLSEADTTDLQDSALLDALRSVVPAMSDDPTRSRLCGVHVDYTDSGMRLVASDGHRIHIVQTDIRLEGCGDDTAGATWPAMFCKQAVRILAANPEKFRWIHMHPHRFGITAGPTDLRSRSMSEKYPNWKKIIPKPLPVQAVFNRKEMLEALSDMDLERNAPVDLSMHKDYILMRGAASAHSRVRCGQSPGELEIRFNSRYLEDALTAARGSRLITLRADPGHPTLKPAEIGGLGDRFSSVIMPMRP